MRKPRRTLLVTLSVGLHMAALFAFVASSIWKIEKIEAGTRPFDLAVAPDAPQESGSPEGSPAPKFKPKHHEQAKEVTHEVTQPPEKKQDADLAAKAVADATASMFGNGEGSGAGSGTGSGNGLGSGTGSGSGSGSADCKVSGDCGPPKDCVADGTCPPLTLPPTLLRGLRTSGETQIHPDDMTKTEIIRSGRTKVVASFRVCIGVHGQVSSMQLAKPSGFARYDSALTAGMRDWTYKPYMLKDAKTGEEHPIPVCGIVTFIYAMQ